VQGVAEFKISGTRARDADGLALFCGAKSRSEAEPAAARCRQAGAQTALKRTHAE